jgi:hypothetical protein
MATKTLHHIDPYPRDLKPKVKNQHSILLGSLAPLEDVHAHQRQSMIRLVMTDPGQLRLSLNLSLNLPSKQDAWAL